MMLYLATNLTRVRAYVHTYSNVEWWEREEQLGVKSQGDKTSLILSNQSPNHRILTHTILCKDTKKWKWQKFISKQRQKTKDTQHKS